MEIVSALRASLADKVGKERYELWFGPHTSFSLGEESLTVSVSSRFQQDWVRSRFRSQLEEACCEVLGKTPALFFQVDSSLNESFSGNGSANDSVEEKYSVTQTTEGSESTHVEESTTRGTLSILGSTRPFSSQADDTPLPSSYGKQNGEKNSTETYRKKLGNFQRFVSGVSNQVALASAQSVAIRPGEISPLVLYGPTGVGKTHLLEAILGHARSLRPRIHAVHVSAEQFTTGFLEALHGSGLPSFRRKYRQLELLLIDDIQFFAGKRATLDELKHTIDTLLQDGRQVVLTADRSPSDLTGLGPELIARLQGGLVCPISLPEYELRLQLVREMSVGLGLELSDEVAGFVAARFPAGARPLSGALKRLQATHLALGVEIDAVMAERCLADLIPQQGQCLQLPDIEKAVCRVFGVEAKDLQSSKKDKHSSYPRMLAMWLARKHTRAAFSEIGDYFGNRSHSTVISAQKKVNVWLGEKIEMESPQGNCRVADLLRRVEEVLLVG